MTNFAFDPGNVPEALRRYVPAWKRAVLRDQVPMWDEVGVGLRAFMEYRWQAEGPGWEPLSPNTIKWKRRLGAFHERGRLWNRLYLALTTPRGQYRGGVWEIVPTSYGSRLRYGAYVEEDDARWGTVGYPYSKVFHEGNQHMGGKQPARPWYMTTGDWTKIATPIINEYKFRKWLEVVARG